MEGGDSKSRSYTVRDIVSQVKNGQLNKAEAVQELKGLLQPSTEPGQPFPERSDTHSADEKFSYAGDSHSKFSQEDRRMLINKLIEKKKLSRGGVDSSATEISSINPTNENRNHNAGYYSHDEIGEDISTGVSESNHGDSIHREPILAWQSQPPAFTIESHDHIKESSHNQHPEIQHPPRRQRYADDHQVFGDARSQRIAQTEAAIRDEMFKECTFKPKVKTLPGHYGAQKDTDTPFYDRVTRWQRDKEAEAARRKQLVDNTELIDCTFRPRINRNSEKAVTEIRGNGGETTHERLFKTNESLLGQRAKFIEEELRRERQEADAECTFRPQIITDRSRYAHVDPKYAYTPQKSLNQSSMSHELKDCTFTPKVKGVRPTMSSAKLYVSTNVVDRLTRPIVAESTQPFDMTYGGDRTVMDISSFMGALNGGGGGAAGANRVSSAGSVSSQRGGFNTPGGGSGPSSIRQRPSSAPMDRTMGSDARQVGPQQIQLFLERQQRGIEAKKIHVDQVKRSTTPNFKPRLNPKSLEISEHHSQGEFLDRVERHILRKEEADQRRHAALGLVDCTFQPQLSAKSAAMRRRSSFEMSRIDLLTKEKNQRQLRLRREQEESTDLTFHPSISKLASSMNKSVLRLNEDPSQHLEWHKERTAKKDKARKDELLMREENEVAGCTFTPVTRDCPAYVKRIAKSMAVIKSARAVTPTPGSTKPLWR